MKSGLVRDVFSSNVSRKIAREHICRLYLRMVGKGGLEIDGNSPIGKKCRIIRERSLVFACLSMWVSEVHDFQLY